MQRLDNYFSIQRFKQLCYLHLIDYWQRVVIAFGVVASIVIITFTLPLLTVPADQLANRITTIGFEAAQNTCIMFYILGGLLLSSNIFSVVHNKGKAFQYLLLPASSFEKFLSAWFMTAIGYTLFSIIALFLLSLLMEGIVVMETGLWKGFSVFNPFDPQFLRSVVVMVIFQSIFLLGGIFFKSYHFVKTLLTMFLFILFMLLMGIPVLVDFVGSQGIIQHQTPLQITAPMFYLAGIAIMVILLGIAFVMFKRKQLTA